jgi:hypothetical protein
MKTALLAAGLLALAPAVAFAQNGGAAAGAATGAVGGAIVGGPVGAAVGGVTGAIVGGTLSREDDARVRRYIVEQRRPSVRVQERVVVGEPLPREVQLYPVPPDVGVRTEYRYGVVNDRAVLVDPNSRRVIEVLE